ncbi:hypothetical protein Tco_0971903 [Tanacetum coccineum]
MTRSEAMFIFYYCRAISEDQRLAGEINALCIGLTAVMKERENFVDELDVLEGRFTLFRAAKIKGIWSVPECVECAHISLCGYMCVPGMAFSLLLGSLVAIVELVAKSAPVLLKYVFSKRLLDYGWPIIFSPTCVKNVNCALPVVSVIVALKLHTCREPLMPVGCMLRIQNDVLEIQTLSLCLKVNERLGSLGVSGIMCMNTFSSILVPVMICASINFDIRDLIIILVPLHKPPDRFTFLSSIIGDPTFNCNSCGGKPGKVMVVSAVMVVVGMTAVAGSYEVEGGDVVCDVPDLVVTMW